VSKTSAHVVIQFVKNIQQLYAHAVCMYSISLKISIKCCVYLSLCELLPEAELVEIRGSKCDLDLIYSSMEALYLCLKT